MFTVKWVTTAGSPTLVLPLSLTSPSHTPCVPPPSPSPAPAPQTDAAAAGAVLHQFERLPEGYNYFRLHPKGRGMLVARPGGIAPFTFVEEYLGEVHTGGGGGGCGCGGAGPSVPCV
jgi:hypothetical protein